MECVLKQRQEENNLGQLATVVAATLHSWLSLRESFLTIQKRRGRQDDKEVKKNYAAMGSGCGFWCQRSADRIRSLKKFILNSYCLLHWKEENKEKEAGKGLFLKKSVTPGAEIREILKETEFKKSLI